MTRNEGLRGFTSESLKPASVSRHLLHAQQALGAVGVGQRPVRVGAHLDAEPPDECLPHSLNRRGPAQAKGK